MKSSAVFALCLAVMGAMASGGCSMMLDDNSAVYSASPGKYDFLDCKGIAARSEGNAKRTVELTALMQRANQDPIGPFVSNMVYRDEFNVVQADQQALRQAADEKRCAPELMKPKAGSLGPMH
jgi:hypothetical protein